MELLMMKNVHRKYDGVHVYWKEKVTSAAAFIWNAKWCLLKQKQHPRVNNKNI
jgi:hypothetical protein